MVNGFSDSGDGKVDLPCECAHLVDDLLLGPAVDPRAVDLCYPVAGLEVRVLGTAARDDF